MKNNLLDQIKHKEELLKKLLLLLELYGVDNINILLVKI